MFFGTFRGKPGTPPNPTVYHNFPYYNILYWPYIEVYPIVGYNWYCGWAQLIPVTKLRTIRW